MFGSPAFARCYGAARIALLWGVAFPFLVPPLTLAADDVPAAQTPADDAGYVFELLVTGPAGEQIPQAKVAFRNRPNITADDVQVGKFSEVQNYSTVVEANAEGELKVQFPAEYKRLTLMIITPGYGPYWAQWDDFPPEQFTAKLDAAWTVGGIVVDEAGQPIAKAKVHPSLEFKKRPGNDFQLAMGNSVETDEHGIWRFESIPDSLESVQLTVSHSSFRPLNISVARSQYGVAPGAEPSQNLILDKGLTVLGFVTDENGTPVADALVRSEFLNESREAKTDAQGKYALPGCAPMQARIVVSAAGKALTKQDVLLKEAGNEPVNFVLQPGGHVRIRIVDAQGKPLPKTRIFFQSWGGGDRVNYFEFDHLDQYANAEGVWEWNEAPTNGFAADVCPPGGMQLPDMPFEPRDAEYVVTALPQLTLSGRVIDAQTKEIIPEFTAIEGYYFSIAPANWNRRQSQESRDGTFSIRPSRAYEHGHAVRIEARGYQAADSRKVLSAEGDVTLDFELEPAIDIFGKILTPGGEPAQEAKLALGVKGTHIGLKNGDLEDGQVNCAKTVADADGRYRFGAPGAEFLLVIAHPEGYALVKSENQVAEKITVLKPWGRVDGTYQIGTEFLGNLHLTMDVSREFENGRDAPSLYFQYSATTDAQGNFVFPKVIPGDVAISRRILFMVNEGAREVASAKRYRVVVKGGETTSIKMGGTGRAVIGKFAVPADFEGKPNWRFASISLTPTAADKNIAGFWASADPDGSFRIDDVDPGNYDFSMHFTEGQPGRFPGQVINVPAGDEVTPIDLGILNVE